MSLDAFIKSGQSREYLHLQNSIKDFPSPTEFVNFIKSTKCPTGYFEVGELIQMNGDSVQLYVSTAVRNDEAKREE
jgi:ubiquinone/menaquinone biosynthesis C-methylase UbiE